MVRTERWRLAVRYRLATALAATLITLVGFASAGRAQSEVPAPEAVQPEAVQPEVADGRTHPGPYFLGRADAPVTLEEYADFQ